MSPPYYFTVNRQNLISFSILRPGISYGSRTNAVQDALAQANPDDDNAEAVAKRYPKAQVRDFDGDPTQVTEMDAVIAY